MLTQVRSTPAYAQSPISTGPSPELEAAGGGSCWGSPEAADIEKHGATLTIEVLPNADGAWTKLAEWYPSTSTPGANYGSYPSRGGDCAQNYCQTNVLVGNVWVAGEASSPTRPAISESEFHALMQDAGRCDRPARRRSDGCCARSAASGMYGRRVCGRSGVELRRGKCFIPRAGNVFRIEAAVGLVPGAEFCPYLASLDGSGGVLVSLTVIPGGASAFEHYRDLLASEGAERDRGVARLGRKTYHGIQRTIPGVEWATTSGDVVSGNDWLSVSSPTVNTNAAVGTVAFSTWVLADH